LSKNSRMAPGTRPQYIHRTFVRWPESPPMQRPLPGPDNVGRNPGSRPVPGPTTPKPPVNATRGPEPLKRGLENGCRLNNHIESTRRQSCQNGTPCLLARLRLESISSEQANCVRMVDTGLMNGARTPRTRTGAPVHRGPPSEPMSANS